MGVHRDHGVPTVRRRVFEAKPAGVAGVVDQNVEGFASVPLGEFVVESREQGRDGRRIDEVSMDANAVPPAFSMAATASSAPDLLAL